MNHPDQTLLNLEIEPKALNTKAMLVRLSIKKPTTSRKDTDAESFTQSSLHDAGLRVSTTIFKDPSSPVRKLLNEATAVYHFHKQNTMPYVDRGPRLLPVEHYEKYRDSMRALVNDVNNATRALAASYDTHVQEDLTSRGSRAKLADYPTWDQFEASLKLQYTFSPLPDESHWLFDVSDEDKAALRQQMADVVSGAQADLYGRLKEPVMKLLEKLRIPAGQPGSIFRDSAVNNITEAVAIARTLCMGDETILGMCAAVETTLLPVAKNPDMLRESPVVREAAVAKLAAVAKRMEFMYGGV